jgi:2'-5' RNA ligase
VTAGDPVPADAPPVGRLFVAVWPPERVLDEIAALDRVGSGVRWTSRDQWHVTLRFLGRSELGPAVDALHRLRTSPSCEAAVRGPAVRLGRGAFVLRVDGLAGLATATNRAFDGIGQPAEERPFVGHLTLARMKRGERVSLPTLALDASWQVQDVSLVCSHLGRGPARYETIAAVDLAIG